MLLLLAELWSERRQCTRAVELWHTDQLLVIGAHVLVPLRGFSFCMCVKVCVWRFSSHFLCLSPLSFALLSVLQKVSSDSLLHNHWPLSFRHIFLFSLPLSLASTCWSREVTVSKCVHLLRYQCLTLCSCARFAMWYSDLSLKQDLKLRLHNILCLDKMLLIFPCRLVQIQIQHFYYILQERLPWYYSCYVFIYRCTLWLKVRFKCEAFMIMLGYGSHSLDRCTWTLRALKGYSHWFASSLDLIWIPVWNISFLLFHLSSLRP